MLPRTRENELRQILKGSYGKNLPEVYIINQEELTKNRHIRQELEAWIQDNSKNLSDAMLTNLINEFTVWFERDTKNLREDAYYYHPYNAEIRTPDVIERCKLRAQQDKQDLEALKKKWGNLNSSDLHIQHRLTISSRKEQKPTHIHACKTDTLSKELDAWFEQHKKHLRANVGASDEDRRQSDLKLQQDKKSLEALKKKWSTSKLEAASVHTPSGPPLTYRR